MAKQKQQASNRPATRVSHQRKAAADPGRQKAEDDARDEANKRRFVDQSGLAAQDLPDGAHGQNVIDAPEHTARNLPHQHGGELGGEGGLRGDRKLSDADRYGGRKRN
jgi:hypothetical protein